MVSSRRLVEFYTAMWRDRDRTGSSGDFKVQLYDVETESNGMLSESPDGSWESLGKITAKGQPNWHASNVMPMLRPDGQYMVVQRSGQIMLARETIVNSWKIRKAFHLTPEDGLTNWKFRGTGC